MNTEIMRHLSASMYTNPVFRERLLDFVKYPYRAIVGTAGLDTKLLIKHALTAKHREKKLYYSLLGPVILFWVAMSWLIYSLYIQFVFSDPIRWGLIIGILSIFYLVALIIGAIYKAKQRYFLQENFSKESFRLDFSFPEMKTELIDDIQAKTTQNVVYYEGYSPFVGSGVNVGGWSFIVDIDKGKNIMDNKISPQSFEELELYEAISREIKSLAIPNLSITGKAFINGSKLKGKGKHHFLPKILGVPRTSISEEMMEQIRNGKISDARYYQMLQIPDWEGEIVISIFLRFQKSEKTLFVENNYYVLLPINLFYKKIDKQIAISQSWFEQFFSFLSTIFQTFYYLFKVLGYFMRESSLETEPIGKNMEVWVEKLPSYNYGASTSIREIVAQRKYTQHFQQLDKERHIKTIEKRIFNTIKDFLDSKGIDTSEFQERETSILNNGVIVSGGNLNSENIAVGKKAQINTQ